MILKDSRATTTMTTSSDRTLIVVMGPTATGKTETGIRISRAFGGAPILSSDSRQMYREIPIGTAMPTAEERAQAPHYFVATRSVEDFYTSGRFETDALHLLNELYQHHPIALLVGGSGLYIDAVCRGIDGVPGTNHTLRDTILARLASEGPEPLLEQLHQLDPVYYAQIDRNNTQRIVRALEVCLETGKPYSALRSGQSKSRPFRILKIGLAIDRELLYARIDQRVDRMLEAGLEEEARRVYPLRTCNALQTVGYKELFDYFDGAIDRDEAIRLIKRNSRRYAKRQLTWFARDPEIRWFPYADTEAIIAYLRDQIGHTGQSAPEPAVR